MAFILCKRCSEDLDCGAGIISVQWSTQGSVKVVGGSCDDPLGSGDEAQYTRGPITGSVNIQAYAFDSNSEDMWLGVRCMSKVQANQTNLMKYDGKTNKYYVLPSSTNNAQITGEYPQGITMVDDCAVKSYNSQLLSGSVSITTEMSTNIGHDLEFNGTPLAVKFPEKDPYTVLTQRRCYLSSFSLEIDYPGNPAKASYTWQFILDPEECES